MKSLLLIYLLSASSADEVSRGSDSLGKALYPALPTDGGNVVFSPFTLHSVLALTYEASAGETENKLRTSLGLSTKDATALQYHSTMSNFNSKTNVTFEIANKVYVRNDRNLNSKFKDVAKSYFFTETESLNFTNPRQAADNINDWIRKKTADKIREIVSPSSFDENTRVVLLNAIYFKGKWATKFDIDETEPALFYVNERKTVRCWMMHQLGEYYYSENADLDATLLKFSFRNERFGLTIILPNSRTGIDDLERKFANANITELRNQFWGRQVEVYLPRFKIESNFNLEPPLKKVRIIICNFLEVTGNLFAFSVNKLRKISFVLRIVFMLCLQFGLSQIFSNDAQFPYMIDGDESLTISKVIQQATIEINEEGGEASTATSKRLIRTIITNAALRCLYNYGELKI